MNPSPGQKPPPCLYLLAAGVCALTTLLALPLYGVVDLANIALLFVLAPVYVAARIGRGPAVFASFLAVACFDFFFVPPRFSFTVAHAQYLITFAVLLLVSLVVSQLTTAYRAKAAEAGRRATESAVLHELASTLSGALDLAQVAERLGQLCRTRLNLDAVLWLPTDQDVLWPQSPEPVGLAEQAAVRGVYASGRPLDGNPALRDGVYTVLLPLEGATRRRGVLALHLAAGGTPLAEDFYAALAAVVATTVERLHFVAVAQASSLEAQSERLRGAILSAISHDLRTPLTVLFGLADALATDHALPAAQREMAATLRERSGRLHRMVENLLDLARLRSGRVVLQRDWQSIPELFAAAARAMSPWLDARRLRFAWPEELPLVEVDAVLLERVFCNLLENAVKYSPADSPIGIGAAVEAVSAGEQPANGAAAPGRQRLRVWIDNAGAGFPADRLARVFDLFERAPGAAGVPGVGVGLAVCRAIVEAHGGRIAAFNRVDGARVAVDLPLGVVPAVPDEETP